MKPGYYLVRMAAGIEKQYHELHPGVTKIGRAINQDVRCISLQVSREHCIIELVGGHVLIRDMQSFNGTFIMDSKIPTLHTVALSNGDLIGLGVQTDFAEADYIFKLVIIEDPDGKLQGKNGIDEKQSENMAMLTSLKRKSLETESAPFPKRLKDRSPNVECTKAFESINTSESNKNSDQKSPQNNEIKVIQIDSDSDSEIEVLVEKGPIKEESKKSAEGEKINDTILKSVTLPKDEQQSSFSLNDEVILLSDSEEDEMSSSQLFSQHVEPTGPMFFPVKEEVLTDFYEKVENDYDNEDSPLDDSITGMFEEHFLHCSQEMSSNYNREKKGDSQIQLSSNNAHPTYMDETSPAAEVLPDDNKEEKSQKTERRPSSEHVKEQSPPLNKEKICTKLDSTETELTVNKVENKVEKPPLKESMKTANKVKRKKQETKMESKGKLNDVKTDKQKSLKLVSDKSSKKANQSPKVQDQSGKVITVVPESKTRELNKQSFDRKPVRTTRNSKARNKETEQYNVKLNTDLEKLKKERREKLKLIALKSKQKSESEVKASEVTEAHPGSEISNTEKSDLKRTIKCSDRSKTKVKSLSETAVSTKSTCSKNVKKDEVKKVSKENRKGNARSKDKQEKVNGVTPKEQNSVENVSKSVVSEKKDNSNNVEEKLAKLKSWEQNIIQKYNESYLDISTGEALIKKPKVLRFKEDLVEVRYFECEGEFTRKVSGKEHRPRKETPSPTPMLQYGWRITLKTNYVLYDVCKWNVTWLEECKKIEGDPPVVRMPYLNVKDCYINYMDYWRSMYPLLMTELWCEVYNDLVIQDVKCYMPRRTFQGIVRNVTINPACINIDNVEGGRIVSVDCLFIGDRDECRKGMAPDEGDLGIMQVIVPRQNNKNICYKTFTFVSSEMKSIPFHRCNDHFAKYLKLNMDKETKERNNDPSTCLYIQVSFCDSPNKPISEGCLLKLRILRNLYKNLRLFDSLSQLRNSELLHQILDPKCIVRPNITKSLRGPSYKQFLDDFPLNQTQIDIVLEVVKDLLSGQPSISLVHGPPGTGKSRVITSLVLQLLQNFSKHKHGVKEKILLCAPSNAATDSLVMKLLEIRQSLPSDKRFKMVRVGAAGTIHRNVKEISSYALAAKEVGNSLDSENLKVDLRLLLAEETSLCYAIDCCKDENSKKRFTAELATLQERKRILESITKDRAGGVYANQAQAKLIREAEIKVLQGAEIIATTLSSCCTRKIMEAIGASSYLRLSCCIIDEATQGIEQEVLLPLLHNVNSFVLVGDPLQLAPTILSQSARKHYLGRSIFHRIWREWEREGNINNKPFYKLTTQHRMHPEIAQFPSAYFYDGLLTTPDFLNVQLPFSPYNIFNHTYSQDSNGETNTKESELVIKLICELNKDPLFKGLSIGVIVPYQKQKQIMERAINNLKDEISYCKVNTVDSYQGQEKDVIIFSCVRTDGIGFLNDRCRVNVALTRAKRCLIIVANFNSLKADSTWKALISDAKKRGVISQIPPDTTSINFVDFLTRYKKKIGIVHT